MADDLSSKVCSACSGDEDPLKAIESVQNMEEINDDWELVDNHHIVREFEFKDFQEALDFVNKVGDIAEEQGHHPIINDFTWGKASIKLFTHKIDGLHENDFIMASRIDDMHEEEF